MVILLLACLLFLSNNGCDCKAVPADELTHWGGNEIITSQEKRSLRKLKGKIEDVNGNPLPDVLVEVFDNPEWIIKGLDREKVEQKRIRACKTGRDGKFCFTDLPAGRYELRSSMGVGFNPDHRYVILDPQDDGASNDLLMIALQPGT